MPIFPLPGLNVTLLDFNIMSGLFKAGMSSNNVQSWMSSMGIGYRRATVQAVRRHVLDLVKFESIISKMSQKEKPSKWVIAEENWIKPYRYKVFGNVEYIDGNTGEYMTQRWSMYSDSLLTPEEAINEMSHQLVAEHYKNALEFTSITVRQFLHKAGASY